MFARLVCLVGYWWFVLGWLWCGLILLVQCGGLGDLRCYRWLVDALIIV